MNVTQPSVKRKIYNNIGEKSTVKKNISVIIVITILMIEAMYRDIKNPNMEMKYLNANNVIIPTLQKINYNVILDPNILRRI